MALLRDIPKFVPLRIRRSISGGIRSSLSPSADDDFMQCPFCSYLQFYLLLHKWARKVGVQSVSEQMDFR